MENNNKDKNNQNETNLTSLSEIFDQVNFLAEKLNIDISIKRNLFSDEFINKELEHFFLEQNFQSQKYIKILQILTMMMMT